MLTPAVLGLAMNGLSEFQNSPRDATEFMKRVVLARFKGVHVVSMPNTEFVRVY
jgi:hypothetical protein